mgnify:CR=1 FL=1
MEIEKLKQELKKVNAEYAGIRDVIAEKRAEFGRKINARKQEILAQIAVVHIVPHTANKLPAQQV